MYRLENQVLDIHDDVNLNSTIMSIKDRIPPFVKSASVPSIQDNDSRPDHAFALCLWTKTANKLLKYPIDTPADAFFSGEYLNANYHKLPAGAVKIAAANINAACRRFGITPSPIVKVASAGTSPLGNLYVENMKEPNGYIYDDELLKQAAAEIPKNSPAFSDSPYMYALVKKAGKNADSSISDMQCKYAMPTPGHVKMAIEYFDKYAEEFTPADRHQFAYNVRMRAQELGVHVPVGKIDKYAGVNGYGPNLEAHISLRKSCCIDSSKQALYDALYEKRASIDPSLFAQTLERLDNQAGVSKYYGGPVSDAYVATFGNAREAFIKRASHV